MALRALSGQFKIEHEEFGVISEEIPSNSECQQFSTGIQGGKIYMKRRNWS